jgi:hypothetical protein
VNGAIAISDEAPPSRPLIVDTVREERQHDRH